MTRPNCAVAGCGGETHRHATHLLYWPLTSGARAKFVCAGHVKAARRATTTS